LFFPIGRAEIRRALLDPHALGRSHQRPQVAATGFTFSPARARRVLASAGAAMACPSRGLAAVRSEIFLRVLRHRSPVWVCSEASLPSWLARPWRAGRAPDPARRPGRSVQTRMSRRRNTARKAATLTARSPLDCWCRLSAPSTALTTTVHRWPRPFQRP
jgi:hypothetical protein